MELPRLPGYVPPQAKPAPYVPPRSTLSRPSARQINQTTPREGTVTLTGEGKIIPVTYGEDRITGLWLVRPYTHIATNELRFAILWGFGPAEGVQAVYINGADVPVGVTMTHYKGDPGQGIDPTLNADIPGFADTYDGCAYTVFRVPAGTIAGFPQTQQIEAVFRGRKLYDPRTGTVAWSRNPALAILDFCTDTRYGPGIPVIGIEAVADRCDELVGGIEVRCQMGRTIDSAQYLDAWLNDLCVYAEALWDYEGDEILVVPDAPGDPVAVIDSDDVVANSYRFEVKSLRDAPTIVTVNWRQSTGTAEQWSNEPASQALPGVATGEVPEIRSDVDLPGIRRSSEANRKALMRLRRLQYPGSYAWQMFDRGIVFQRGDIVQLPDTRGLNSWLVRILSIEMVSRGVYQITAEHYDPSIYPEDIIPGEQTTVPVGAVVLTLSNVLESGWQWWTDADGYILRCGDTEGVVPGTGPVTISGTTADSPPHTGIQDEDEWFQGEAGPNAGSQKPAAEAAAPTHTHDYTSAAISHTPQNRTYRFMQKTGAPGQLPINAGVFANGVIISPALSELTSNLGRLIASNSAQNPTNSGQSSLRTVAITTTLDGAHRHGDFNRELEADATSVGPPRYNYVAAPNHHHNGNIRVNFNVKRARLAIYVATSETDVTVGDIVGWPDGLGSPPSGWHYCDGTNGTPNLNGCCIEHSSATNAGAILGNDTATWSDNTAVNGLHNHKGTQVPPPNNTTAEQMRHAKDDGAHSHVVSGSVSYRPDVYVLPMIQYTGVP